MGSFRETACISISETLPSRVFRNPKHREEAVARVSPVQPPYESQVGDRLEAMMPPGVPPILLFRTFVRNLPMAEAMGDWGSYELSKRLSLSMGDREIVIDRTCARCRCRYEWGVHVAFFADRVGLTAEQVASLTHGGSSDPCWSSRKTVFSSRWLMRCTTGLASMTSCGRASLRSSRRSRFWTCSCCAVGTTPSASLRTASSWTWRTGPLGSKTFSRPDHHTDPPEGAVWPGTRRRGTVDRR